jgi:hypothetical protein
MAAAAKTTCASPVLVAKAATTPAYHTKPATYWEPSESTSTLSLSHTFIHPHTVGLFCTRCVLGRSLKIGTYLKCHKHGEQEKTDVIDRMLVAETKEHHQAHDRCRKKTKNVTVGLSCDSIDDSLTETPEGMASQEKDKQKNKKTNQNGTHYTTLLTARTSSWNLIFPGW